jgi:aminobenzoyl-glutamate utilization protein B
MPLNIVAAIAVKRIMQRDKLPGTIVLWPGVAEEQLATKAYYVRAGLFKDVDVVLLQPHRHEPDNQLGRQFRQRSSVGGVHVPG